MKNINLILTVVNILILAINSSLSVFKYLTDRKLLYNERIWDPLEKKLFKPYLHKIEIFLFQKWEGDNQKKIYNGIATLKKLLDSEESDLRMYLPAKFIYNLNHCYTQMTNYYSEIDLKKKKKYLERAQYSFLSFSREYLKLLNKYRNYSFLPRYHADERYYFEWYHSFFESKLLLFKMGIKRPFFIFNIIVLACLWCLQYIKH